MIPIHRAVQVAVVAASLASGVLWPRVAGAARAAPASASTVRTAKADSSLGSARNPIRMNATEINALRRTPASVTDRLQANAGRLRMVLFGVPVAVLSAGGATGPSDDGLWGPETNLCAGAGVGVPVERSGGLFADGARVVTREPLELLQRGSAHGEYWTTSVGFQVRF